MKELAFGAKRADGFLANHMHWKRILFVCGLAAALPMLAPAAKIIICSTCDPTLQFLTSNNGALSEFVQPDGTGLVTAEFLNVTGTIIDNFTFETTINPNLNQAAVLSEFTCAQLDQNGNPVTGFFLNCSVSYSQDGLLSYLFSGVNPPETGLSGFVDATFTSEQNEQEGIPFCNTSILTTGACTTLGVGIFQIQLQGFTDSLTAGGVDFYDRRPTFINSFNNVPEPSSALIFLTEFLLLTGFVSLFRRRLIWRRRFNL